MATRDPLGDELADLRKGRGLRRPNVGDRVGPELRRLAAIADTTTHTDARARLTALLDSACAALAEDLGLAVRVVLGMEPGYPDPTLTGRQSRLAAAWGVDPITVRRRSDLALKLLAAQLAEHGAAAPGQDDPFRRDEWYLVRSATVLRLDRPRPEASQLLTVAALKHGLASVDLGVSIPMLPPANRTRLRLEAEVQFGGDLEPTRQVWSRQLVHRVRFPRPLAKGETHTFGLMVRIPDGQPMAPFFVSRVWRRVDRMELRVRFDRARLPTAVWQVAGIPYALGADDGPTEHLLEPDAVAEVAVEFDRLVLGLGYGVAWLPRLTDPV